MKMPLIAQALDHDPNGFECYISQLDEGAGCQFILTRYSADVALYTITTTGEDLLHCVRQLIAFRDWADTDFKDSKLILPHMGDFEIEYHP